MDKALALKARGIRVQISSIHAKSGHGGNSKTGREQTGRGGTWGLLTS